jgi:hypothetical protein
MKRLNPATDLPFKKGDTRKDGYIFRTYYHKKVSKNGFFKEEWVDPEKFYKTFRTLEGKARSLYDGAKNRARKDKLDFNLTIPHIINLMSSGVCSLTGIPFCYEPHSFRQNPRSPSLDKIDSSKGYTIENVRVVLWLVNAALQQCSDSEALPILEALVKGLKKNAKKKSITPIPNRFNRKSKNNPEHGASTLPGAGENDNHINDYSGATQGENAYRSAKEGSGDGMGRRGDKMATLVALTRLENNGESDAEVVRLDFGGRYLLDKP